MPPPQVPGLDVEKAGPACAHEGEEITYTITVEEEEWSIKLIMRDFISYVIRGRRARYKKALDVLLELQKIEEKEGIKVYKDRALERSDRR